MNLPTFTTSRLILRAINENDYSSYEKYFNDYDVIRFLVKTVPWPYPKNGVKDYIEQQIFPYLGNDRWLWGIFLKALPHELIGAIELRRIANPDNRGFWLGKHFWGKGIMTEALAPITEYAFDILGFEKMIFTNAVGNRASRRLKEKMSARFLYREAAEFVDPSLKEHEVWELSKKDWQKEQ